MPVKYEPWGIKKEDEDLWGIHILEGKYEGSIISFNDIEFNNQTDSNDGGIKLDYSIYKMPNNIKENSISEDDDFRNIMSGIIEDILQKAIELNENRTNNSSEPNT